MAEQLFEEIGEGWLALGGSGISLGAQSKANRCPVAQRNSPTRRDGVDTAYIRKFDGVDIYQWCGRKADGRFHPIGKFLRLTPAGRAALTATEPSDK